MADSEPLAAKQRAVDVRLRSLGRALIALSGGVDSALLTKLARLAVGPEAVLAVTADSPSLAREELAAAMRTARELDVPHRIIQTHELANAAYRANAGDRCYFCKQELLLSLDAIARAEGFAAVLYGAIGDDRLAERPGQLAALEAGVRAPLQEAGFSKPEVRELARRLGLSAWDRPQNACLASRLPHGTEVTAERLRQVEEAEAFLRTQGFHQVRVRHLGARARIEVARADVGRFQDDALCAAVARRFEQLGFATVSVERSGYRPGGADHPAVDEISLSAIAKC